MKEHTLFLQAAFPAGERECRNKASWYREEFEKILWQTVRLSDGMAGKSRRFLLIHGSHRQRRNCALAVPAT